MTLSPEDIAYIAGLIDVRANIRTTTVTSGAHLPLVSVSTSEMELIGFLGKTTGVKTFTIDRNYHAHQCNQHCPDPHLHRVSTSGRWSVNGAKATVALAAISPYVLLQRVPVEESLEVGLNAPYKPATLDKMKALGWPMPEGWE